MLPLAAHFSRRSSRGEQGSKTDAAVAAAPAATAAAAPAAAPAAQQPVAQGPPVVDPSTGEAFPANQHFWWVGGYQSMRRRSCLTGRK